jgi:hypothetical protein
LHSRATGYYRVANRNRRRPVRRHATGDEHATNHDTRYRLRI